MAKEIINYAYQRFYLNSIEHYKQFSEWSKTSFEEFKERQFRHLSHLLDYSYKNIPYYRQILSETSIYHKGSIKLQHIDQFSELPILTKDIIRSEGENMYVSSSVRKERGAYTNTSGGSTGEPIKVIQDREYGRSASGLFAFIKSIRTNNPYSDSVYLWGATRDLYGEKNNIRGVVIDVLNNMKKFNSAKLTPENIRYFIDYINNKKPSLIVAYVNSIYEVALFAKANNIKVVPQKAIHTGAGQLFDFMREAIESVFQTKVYNHYGGREMGAIATECSAFDGLHILGDAKYVEVVDEDGNSKPEEEEGDILVTTLNNFSMPLIRYKVEDRGIMSTYKKCKCGIVYPKLSRVTGRISNNFRLADGGIVSGEYLTLTFNHVKGVINFQIKQVDYNFLEISIVTNQHYHKKQTEQHITQKMMKLFGTQLNIKFLYVTEIPTTASGKHLFTLSELSH